MEKDLRAKANAIAKSIVPRPSVYAHEDEHTYLYNQLIWAIDFSYQILSEMNTDKEKATEKWTTELEKTKTNVTKRKIIKTCLSENFLSSPQKCSLTKQEEDEHRQLAILLGWIVPVK